MAIGPGGPIGPPGGIGPRPPTTPAVTTVTADMWLMRWERPRRVLLSVGVAGAILVPTAPVVIPYTDWPVAFGEAARPIERPAPQGYHLFVPRAATIDNTTNTVWPLAAGEIPRPIVRPAQQGHHLFVPREATLENTTNRTWPLTKGELARPISRAAQQGYHLFTPKEATVENTITISWPLTLGEKARPIEAPAQQGQHLFVPAEATLDNTTNRVWPLTQGEIARPIVKPAPSGWYAFGYPYLGVDNSQTIDKWQQPLSRAVPIPRPSPLGGSPFIPKEATRENTTNLVWPLAQGEVARPIQRIAQQGTWVFGYPYEAVAFDNNITGIGWHQPFYQATPRRPFARTQPNYVTVNFNNNIVGMAWHQPFPTALNIGWPRKTYLRGGSPFVPKEATLENTGTLATWLMRWQGPPRYRPPKLISQPFVPREATVENTIRGIAWHMPLSIAAKHAKLCLSQPSPHYERVFVAAVPVRRIFSDVYYY